MCHGNAGIFMCHHSNCRYVDIFDHYNDNDDHDDDSLENDTGNETGIVENERMDVEKMFVDM